jgi:hypothetical protein
MNLFTVGNKIETVIQAAKADVPVAKAWVDEADKTILPLSKKIIADMIARKVATKAEFDAAQVTLEKLPHIIDNLVPLVEGLDS